MKSHRIVLGLIIFAALAAALAWQFWPGDEPAASASQKSEPSAPIKTASLPVKAPEPPPAPARIAMPTMPAAPTPASATPSVAASNASTILSDEVDAQARDIAAKQAAMQQAMLARLAQEQAGAAGAANVEETDWGEIQVTDGVPMDLTTSTGDPVTLTPTVRPDGTLQLALKMQRYDENGNIRSEMTTMLITKPGQSVSIRTDSQSFKMTPTL